MSEALQIPDTSTVDATVSAFTDQLPKEMDYTITLTCTYGDPKAAGQHQVEERHRFDVPTPVPVFKWVFMATKWMHVYPQEPGVQIQFIYTRDQNSVSIDQTLLPP